MFRSDKIAQLLPPPSIHFLLDNFSNNGVWLLSQHLLSDVGLSVSIDTTEIILRLDRHKPQSHLICENGIDCC